MQPDKACEKGGIRCEIFYKYPAKCAICPDRAYYSPEKVRTKKSYQGKKSNRQGARFETENHERNEKLLTASRLTRTNYRSGSDYGRIENPCKTQTVSWR